MKIFLVFLFTVLLSAVCAISLYFFNYKKGDISGLSFVSGDADNVIHDIDDDALGPQCRIEWHNKTIEDVRNIFNKLKNSGYEISGEGIVLRDSYAETHFFNKEINGANSYDMIELKLKGNKDSLVVAVELSVGSDVIIRNKR